MKKIVALVLALMMLVGAIGAAFALTETNTKNQANDLLALLPASDAVAVIDMKRFSNETVPQLLAAKPEKLTQINAQIDEFRARTGIDLRSFESVAVGAKFNRIRPNELDVEPVAVARGTFNAGAMMSAGKTILNGKFREEKIGGKTAYVFQIRDAVQQLHKDKNSDKLVGMTSRLLTGEVAVVSLDASTLAFGNSKQVRSLLASNARNRINADLVSLVQKNPNAVVSFAGNTPQTFASLFGMSANDDFAGTINSLRQIYGTMDVTGDAASMMLTARTGTPVEAEQLESTLRGLQAFGGMLGRRKDEKSQALTRVVENLKITRAANEVQLQTAVPQTDFGKLF